MCFCVLLCTGMYWNVLECIGMYWNVSDCIVMHVPLVNFTAYLCFLQRVSLVSAGYLMISWWRAARMDLCVCCVSQTAACVISSDMRTAAACAVLPHLSQHHQHHHQQQQHQQHQHQ